MDNALDQTVKWTVSVPRELDVALRLHLAQAGLRKGDLSRFVVEAVQAHLTRQNLVAARERNREVGPNVMQRAVAGAVAEVRADTFGTRS